MQFKKLVPAFAALAMAFTLTHAGLAMAEEAADSENMTAEAPTDDMYADFAKTVDAQFRPPPGHGGGGPRGPGHGGGGPGRGGGGPGHGPGHGGGGPRRMVSCLAYDIRGNTFEGRGWDAREAARNAQWNCERNSRARRPRCEVSYRTCR